MTYRDFHPNDLILIYGDVKVVSRVDITHLATRGPDDSLELWGYGKEVQPISVDNKLVMSSLGFYERDGLLKYDTKLGAIEINLERGMCDIPYGSSGDIYVGRKPIKYLHELQQFYFNLHNKELKFDV